jgi:hypothetical protein
MGHVVGVHMEWFLGIVLSMMLALLCYSVVSTSFEVGKKAQPFVDSFFDVLYGVLHLQWSKPKERTPTQSSKN